jgi:DNA-binding MarR family transcriptional regulator
MNAPVCDVDDIRMASGWDVMIEARRVQHRFEVAMDQCLQAFGISYAQYRALLVLLGDNEMHVSSLARRLRVTRQAALATVTKLARADLVEFERESHTTYVLVTPTARARLAHLQEFADMPVALEAGLTDVERGRLVALLRKADRSLRPPRRPTWWLED